MGQCWFCGVNTDQTIECSQCKKAYCNLHADPSLHDCPGVPIVYLNSISASHYLNPATSTQVPLQGQSTAGYVPSAEEFARSTQDGSYTWHGKKEIPENAFNPDSGVEMKMVFWPRGSEAAHLLIGGGLMFLFGFLLFLVLQRTIPQIETWHVLLIAAIFTGSFLGHEFGHRQVARHYKMQTKFRLFTMGLIITGFSIGLAFFGYPGFGFPGAVVVIGLDKISRETGHCKVAGPLVNVGIGTTLFFLAIFSLKIGIPFPLNFVLYYAAYFNFQLGLFNMLPFGPLDGQNIFKWKPAVWVMVMAVLAIFFGYTLWSLTNNAFIYQTFLGVTI